MATNRIGYPKSATRGKVEGCMDFRHQLITRLKSMAMSIIFGRYLGRASDYPDSSKGECFKSLVQHAKLLSISNPRPSFGFFYARMAADYALMCKEL